MCERCQGMGWCMVKNNEGKEVARRCGCVNNENAETKIRKLMRLNGITKPILKLDELNLQLNDRQEVLDKLTLFLKSKEYKNCFLWSLVGRGKSLLLRALLFDILSQGIDAFYITSLVLQTVCVNAKCHDREALEIIDDILHTKVLIIDDLDAETESNRKPYYEKLSEILDGFGGKVIFSSNNPIERTGQIEPIRAISDHRLHSRMWENLFRISYTGDDLRKEKLNA